MTNAPRGFACCVATFVASLCVAGCAGIGTSEPSAEGPGSARTPSGERLAPQTAMDKVAIGSSTKAQVLTELGKAIVVPFDSGHEVWVYRWPGPDRTTRSATELVLLFDSSGVLKKRRVRPGYPPRE